MDEKCVLRIARAVYRAIWYDEKEERRKDEL